MRSWHGAAEGLEEDRCAEGVCQRYSQDALPEAADPVSQRCLIGMCVIVRDRSYTHEPFMGDSAHGEYAILHGEVDVASTTQLALPALLQRFVTCSRQALKNQILGVVIPPAARTEFREYAAIGHQLDSFVVRSLLLIIVVPVLIAELEVCLTDKCEQGHLVQDSVQPSAFNIYPQVANVFRTASVPEWCEGSVDLPRRSKSKRAKEAQVSRSEIGTCFAEKLELVQGHGNISKL